MTSIIYPNVQPQFQDISFRDDDSMTLALNHVLKIRRRTDDDNALAAILSQNGLTTIGHLRLLSDTEWRSLKMPAICILYLREVLRKADRVQGVTASFGGKATAGSGLVEQKGDPFLRKLELDFNAGRPFSMDVLRANINKIIGMGFAENQALEALCITNNSLENAMEMIVLSPRELAQRRKAAVQALGGRALQLGAGGGEGKNEGDAVEQGGPGGNELEVFSKYQGYLRGLTASDKINLSELAKLKLFREELKITDEIHIKALRSIGLTEKEFDGMKNTAEKSDRECVVCLDNPKEIVVQPCNHLCLCEECTEMFKSEKDPRCPMCSKSVQTYLRVYS